MKNMTKLFAIAVVILGFSATSFAQASTERIASFTATANVSEIAEVTGKVVLDFGSIGSNLAGGTVIISTDGGRTGTAALLPGDIGNAGAFTIAGAANDVVNLTMPTGLTTLTAEGDNNMTILSADWVFKIGNGDIDNNNDFVMVGNSVDVKIGATLQVGESQAAGSYEGEYAITIAFN